MAGGLLESIVIAGSNIVLYLFSSKILASATGGKLNLLLVSNFDAKFCSLASKSDSEPTGVTLLFRILTPSSIELEFSQSVLG